MKKHFIILIVVALAFSSCQESVSNELTTIAIQDPIRHYFPVIQGKEQHIGIKVFNTGKNLLTISKVYPSCGCTVAKFPKSPIGPGRYGVVELTYDSNKNLGYVGVYTTIVTNTAQKTHTVFFDLNVVPDADYIRDYEQLYAGEDGKDVTPPVKKMVKKPVSKGYTTDSVLD